MANFLFFSTLKQTFSSKVGLMDVEGDSLIPASRFQKYFVRCR